MYTVLQLSEKYGYSKYTITKACHRAGIKKIGNQFVITTKKQEASIIKEIKSRKPGNPNFVKKNKNLGHNA